MGTSTVNLPGILSGVAKIRVYAHVPNALEPGKNPAASSVFSGWGTTVNQRASPGRNHPSGIHPAEFGDQRSFKMAGGAKRPKIAAS